MPKYNLGHKMDNTEMAVPSSESKKEIYYPSIHISTEDVEGLDLKLGDKVKLVGVVTGVDERKKDEEKKKIHYDIDIEQLNSGISEKEYLDKPDNEKDEIDEKDIKDEEE